MLQINLRGLIKNYNQNLLDNLRGFGKEDEFLKFWVPGTNEYQSFLNLLDALVETKIFNVKIIIDEKDESKKLIEEIESFLPKISDYEKNSKDDFINLIIKVDKAKYENHLIKKRSKNKEIKELEIDKTKHVRTYKTKELLKPLYKKNLNLFSPKNFFSNKDIENKDIFIEKIENTSVFFKINNHIIEDLYHNEKDNSDLKKLIDMFFELILKKNIQEAADHGTIYLEEKIRLANNEAQNEGIILSEQAGSYFNSMSNAIRNVFLNYKTKTNVEFDINKNYFETSAHWKKLDNEEKLLQINSILKKVCQNSNSLTKESIIINKIEHNFKIYLKVDNSFRKLQQDKNILLDIEVKLKRLDDTLEVFVDEILDQNKLRLKNSPQNI